jgi:hypothetical protein
MAQLTQNMQKKMDLGFQPILVLLMQNVENKYFSLA